MDIIDASRLITRELAARLESGRQLDLIADGGDDDPASWLVRRMAGPGLLGLATVPLDESRIMLVVAELIGRAGADRDFAAELLQRAAACPTAPGPTEAQPTAQQAAVTGAGVVLNTGRDLDASGARFIGRDDNSGLTYHLPAGGTAIHQPVTNVTGEKSQVYVGSKVFLRRFILLPFGFVVRTGQKVGTAAAAHPAVAVATCTVVVAGGVAGAAVLAQSPPTLSAAPVTFAGLWQGTIAEPGKKDYAADVAITGGPVQGTVGSVNLVAPACTSTLTLTEAQEQKLTIDDNTTSGSCPSGTLVLTPQGDELRYTLARTDGTTAVGVLKRVQSFVPVSLPAVTSSSASKPLSIENRDQPVTPLPSNANGWTVPAQYPTVAPGSMSDALASTLDTAIQKPIVDWANEMVHLATQAEQQNAVSFPPGNLPTVSEATTVSKAGQIVSLTYTFRGADDLGGDQVETVIVRSDTGAVVPELSVLTSKATTADGLKQIADKIDAANSQDRAICGAYTPDMLAKDLQPTVALADHGIDATIVVRPDALDIGVERGRQNCGLKDVVIPFDQLTGLVDPTIVALAEGSR